MPAILRLQEAATSHLGLRERVATPSEGNAVGPSWQQGPLLPGAIGRFLVPEPLPKRLLWAEPLRRRRAEDFGGNRENAPDQPVVVRKILKLLEREGLVALR